MRIFKCVRKMGPDPDKITSRAVFYGGYWCVFSNEDKEEVFNNLMLISSSAKYPVFKNRIVGIDEKCWLTIEVDDDICFDIRFNDKKLKNRFYHSVKFGVPFLVQEGSQGFLIQSPGLSGDLDYEVKKLIREMEVE